MLFRLFAIFVLLTVTRVDATPRCCTCKILVGRLSKSKNVNCDQLHGLVSNICRGNKQCVGTFDLICGAVAKKLGKGEDPHKICSTDLNYCTTPNTTAAPTPNPTASAAPTPNPTARPTPTAPTAGHTANCGGPRLDQYRDIALVSQAASKLVNDSLKGECGGCGLAYQSCCVGYQAAGHPCHCKLQQEGDADTCGDCGCAWEWCCHSTATNPIGNCKCPIGPS